MVRFLINKLTLFKTQTFIRTERERKKQKSSDLNVLFDAEHVHMLLNHAKLGFLCHRTIHPSYLIPS